MFFEDCVAAMHRMDAERRRALLRWVGGSSRAGGREGF